METPSVYKCLTCLQPDTEGFIFRHWGHLGQVEVNTQTLEP
jgi:hypothetical protein